VIDDRINMSQRLIMLSWRSVRFEKPFFDLIPKSKELSVRDPRRIPELPGDLRGLIPESAGDFRGLIPESVGDFLGISPCIFRIEEARFETCLRLSAAPADPSYA